MGDDEGQTASFNNLPIIAANARPAADLLMSNTPSRTTPPSSPSGGLVTTFVLTGVLLLASQTLLGGSTSMFLPGALVLGLGLALLATIGGLRHLTGSLEWGIGITVIAVAFLGPVAGPWLLVPILALGAVWYLGARQAQVTSRVSRLSVLLGAIIVCLLVLGFTHYADFLIREKLPYGDVPQDTLMHASISAMIKTYGTVSTGLNGLAPLHSHVLWQRLIAGWSAVTGVSIMDVYGTSSVVFLSPLLFLAVSLGATRLPRASQASGLRIWLAMCGVLALIKILPLEDVAFWDTYLMGDSYTISVALLALALPPLASGDASLRDRVGACVLLLLAGLAKGSTGVVGLALLWTRIIFRSDRRQALALATATTVCFAVLMGEAAAERMGAQFTPFFYMQLHGQVYRDDLRGALSLLMQGGRPDGTAILHMLIGLAAFMAAYLWIPLGAMLSALPRRDQPRQPEPAELWFPLVAVGVTVVAMQIEFTAAWDFLNVGMFVSLPFLLLSVARIRGRLLTAALACLITGVSLASLLLEGRAGVGVFLKTQGRMTTLSAAGSPGPGAAGIDALAALRDTPPTMVYERGADFPGPPTELLSCAAYPFLYPAVSEHAWTGLLSGDDDCAYRYYGYFVYFDAGPPRTLKPAVVPPSMRLLPAQAR